MATGLRRFWPWALLVASALGLLIGLGLVFGSATFGSAAEWAAAIGTIAAFGGTVVLLRQEVDARRRDVEERERRQAALVSCWLEPDGLSVRNASQEPIYGVSVDQDPGKRERAPMDYRDVIPPGEKLRFTWDPDTDVDDVPVPILDFNDAAGLEWHRDRHGILRRGLSPLWETFVGY
jgi:hypothetical protein